MRIPPMTPTRLTCDPTSMACSCKRATLRIIGTKRLCGRTPQMIESHSRHRRRLMGMLQLRARDGHSLSAYMVPPEGKPRGGVVVVQEVFGLTSHIRRVTEQYAGLGYLAIAPALFDRVRRNVELPYTQVQAGLELMTKTTNEGVLADLHAAIDTVAHTGPTGMVGYCWGGRSE